MHCFAVCGGGGFRETKPTEGARDIRQFWVIVDIFFICMYSYIHVHIQSNLIDMGNL